MGTFRKTGKEDDEMSKSIVAERRRRGAVCCVCRSPDYSMTPPVEGETTKPTFECRQCGRSWAWGRDGGVYAELAPPLDEETKAGKGSVE